MKFKFHAMRRANKGLSGFKIEFGPGYKYAFIFNIALSLGRKTYAIGFSLRDYSK